MEDNKEKVVFSKEYNDKQLDFISSMLNQRNYSLLSGVPVISTEINRPRRITRDAIRKAVTDPYKHIELLQQASQVLKATNGIYKRVLNYQSNMLTNDYTIHPLEIDKIKNQSKIQKSYMETALFLERYNIKSNASWIYSRVLEQGELYICKVEDASGVLFQEIPNKLCTITSIEQGIFKFGVNLKKLNDDLVILMPKEVQSAYKRLKAGTLKESDLIKKTYYEIKKDAYAFNLDRFSTKGVPFFCTIFDDLMELEDMKDLKSQNAVIESIKLIHQKLPIDKDTGEVLMDFPIANQYHLATKQHLPKNTAITTNPLDVTSINLSDSNSKINNNVANALDNVYDSAGINVELFNGKKNSNEAIASGIVSDSLVSKPLQAMVRDWINYELRNNKKSGITWEIRFIETTEFNKSQIAKSARESMAFGGSRLDWLAKEGFTPLQAMATLSLERSLGFDELLVPQQSAHTLSGEQGSPTKEESGNDSGNSTQPSNETR